MCVVQLCKVHHKSRLKTLRLISVFQSKTLLGVYVWIYLVIRACLTPPAAGIILVYDGWRSPVLKWYLILCHIHLEYVISFKNEILIINIVIIFLVGKI